MDSNNDSGDEGQVKVMVGDNSSKPEEFIRKQPVPPILTTDTSGVPRIPKVPSLGVPITPPDLSKRKTKLRVIAMGFVGLVVVIGIIFGIYAWQHSKVNSLTQSVLTAEAKTAPLEAQIKSLQTSLLSTEPNVANNKNVFQIPSLGIEFSVPNELADVTTSINSSGTVVNLSTQTLATLDPGCAANFSNGKALGDFSIVTGSFNNTTNSTLIQQFSNYFVAYSPPTGACSSIASVNTLDNSLVTALKNSFSTIHTISK
jgi:hypothetical protein